MLCKRFATSAEFHWPKALDSGRSWCRCCCFFCTKKSDRFLEWSSWSFMINDLGVQNGATVIYGVTFEDGKLWHRRNDHVCASGGIRVEIISAVELLETLWLSSLKKHRFTSPKHPLRLPWDFIPSISISYPNKFVMFFCRRQPSRGRRCNPLQHSPRPPNLSLRVHWC